MKHNKLKKEMQVRCLANAKKGQDFQEAKPKV